jgi:transposase
MMKEREDPAMRNQRTFSLEFKRQVVEELLSGQRRPAQVCRRYEISSSLLYHWKRLYARGKLNNEPTEAAALRDRVEKLERLVGKLTLENEFLKKGLQNSLSQLGRNGRSSHAGDGSCTVSVGGAS